MAGDLAKAGAILFSVTIVQVTIVASIVVLGGTPDLVLVTIAALALLRGSVAGALAGFWAGLLLDTANLQTLGVTSLLLTLAGYWIGRYGETTARDQAHAPILSVAVITVLFAAGQLVLHFMLGEAASARVALVETLPGAVLLNLLLTLPVYATLRALFPTELRRPQAREVELLG